MEALRSWLIELGLTTGQALFTSRAAAVLGVILLGLLAITTFTHVVFFGGDRYHLAVSPVLCLLAAAALRRGVPPAGSQAQDFFFFNRFIFDIF